MNRKTAFFVKWRFIFCGDKSDSELFSSPQVTGIGPAHERRATSNRGDSSASGVVGLVLGIAGTLATWNRGLWPRWVYALAIMALAMPCASVGGRLRVKELLTPVSAMGLIIANAKRKAIRQTSSQTVEEGKNGKSTLPKDTTIWCGRPLESTRVWKKSSPSTSNFVCARW